jgi:uracil-DNA glycosylase
MPKFLAERARTEQLLRQQIQRLLACRRCPRMHKPVVSCGPVVSKVILLGQAPGDKEPALGRPFAWTAGKTLFRWFEGSCGLSEGDFRKRIYLAAVCRCFPGKKTGGGDRVPDPEEVANCAAWFEEELEILRPELVISVGRLALSQFMSAARLDQVIGRQFRVIYKDHPFDLAPLPHPSGASPWHRIEPGKTLLDKALAAIREHPAMDAVLRGEHSP